MMTTLISLSAAEFDVSIPFIMKFIDALFPEAEISIELSGSESSMRRVPLFWIWKREEGARLRVAIKGKPSFCQIAAGHMVAAAASAKGLQDRELLEALATVPVDPESVKAYRWSRVGDFFRFENSVKVDVTGDNYKKERFLVFWEEESGLACHLTIRGKPRFCVTMSAYIKKNIPAILSLFLLGNDAGSMTLEEGSELPQLR